jgi:hypothetical protein
LETFSTASVRLGHPGDVRCMTALRSKAEVDPRCCYVAECHEATYAMQQIAFYSITSSARQCRRDNDTESFLGMLFIA